MSCKLCMYFDHYYENDENPIKRSFGYCTPPKPKLAPWQSVANTIPIDINRDDYSKTCPYYLLKNMR